jgi:hypothetical protein
VVVAHKDVVLAVLGASTAIAALVLVFLGLLVTGAQSIRPTDPAEVRTPYRVVGGLALGAFLLSLGSSGVSTWWLVGSQSGVLYIIAVVLFLAVLCLLVPAAGWTYIKQIWG